MQNITLNKPKPLHVALASLADKTAHVLAANGVSSESQAYADFKEVWANALTKRLAEIEGNENPTK